MLTSLPPTRPPAASTEESQGTEYTEVYQEYTRSSHLSRFLAHAHTVCTRLSFPPTQLIKTGKERLGTRLGMYMLMCSLEIEVKHHIKINAKPDKFNTKDILTRKLMTKLMKMSSITGIPCISTGVKRIACP